MLKEIVDETSQGRYDFMYLRIAIQGKDCLVQKFRNSSVMLEHPSFRPKIFRTGVDPLGGTEEPFPGPDNPSKMRRSVENAEHVGEASTRAM
ncbi:MAG: hypothetical protein LQ345_006740 [Seirophora villosa]|nr:MAG: hypothetical protein LQ345_006740 [Seirophora villosa]